MSKRLIVIDGHNFLWRSYAVPFRFSSARGTPLHVITTFLKLIRRSVAVLPGLNQSDHLIIVFDSDNGNENFSLSKDYKSNRKLHFSDTEDSPYQHLPHIKKALDYLKIGYIEQPGYEGDDVAASISHGFLRRYSDGASYIFSSDSDFYQLVGEHSYIVNLKAQDTYDMIDKAFIERKLGIDPSDYIFFKSLTGDTSDNIKGIRGIGPKTAKAILSGEKTFDEDGYKELLSLNRKLIQLNTECDNMPDIDQYLFDPTSFTMQNSEIYEACGF